MLFGCPLGRWSGFGHIGMKSSRDSVVVNDASLAKEGVGEILLMVGR